MKKIFNVVSKKLNRLFIDSKKTIRSNKKNYMSKALASLFVFIFVIGQAIKEFVFNKNVESSILVFLFLSYVTFSHFDEHVILAIAMLLCLYFSYETITSLIKGELKSRNDQIYKESLNNTKQQVNILSKKRKLVQDLENFTHKVKQIKNSSLLLNNNSLQVDTFQPTINVKKDLEMVIYEELYFLDHVYSVKNTIFENMSTDLDADLEFTNSKIEDLSM